MRVKTQLKEIASYSKGSQINGDELVPDGAYDYLNGGIVPSGKWIEYNTLGGTVTISEGGNSCGFVNYMQKPFWCGAHCYYLFDTLKNSKYLYYLLKSQQNRLMGIRTGACMPNIKKADLGRFEVEYDTDEEQQEKVVSILTHVESIISSRQHELQMLDELIKARFVELFGSIHEDRFPKCKLKEVAHIKHGYAFSGEFFSDEDNGIVLVTPGNFAIGGGFQEKKNRYYTSEYSEEYVLHAGDLIVTMTDLSKKADTLGYGAIVPDTDKVYLHNQRIGLFDKLDEKLNPVFVRWYMQTDEYRLEIVRTSTGSTVHHTSPDRILNSTIYLPPTETQILFAEFAKQVDKSKVVVQEALDEAQLLFDSLMQKYFG